MMPPLMAPPMGAAEVLAWATEEVGAAVGSGSKSAVGLESGSESIVVEGSAPACDARPAR